MKYRWIVSVKLIILSLLLLSTLGGWCDGGGGNGETPPDSTGCGVGEDEFGVYIWQYPPWEFDCRHQGSFQIEFEPNINNSYEGFNRMYFRLKKGASTYRSNYVEFYSDDESVQQLEWGGSLPSGEYKVTGFLENIQLNSACEDSIYRDRDVDLGEVDIIEFSNPEKVMEIEYFCQMSYNVFSSPHTSEYMDIAFNIADTRYNVTTHQTDLPDSLILATNEAIRRYIADHKQFDNEMFLCGIKGFRNYQGNFIVDLIGATWMDTITFVPTCSTGSLVAVQACIEIVADKYEIDYNDFITATTIHELGWQRGIKPSDWHDSEFCIMNVGLVVDTTEVPFNRYSNPHFCNSCVNKIKNTNW